MPQIRNSAKKKYEFITDLDCKGNHCISFSFINREIENEQLNFILIDRAFKREFKLEYTIEKGKININLRQFIKYFEGQAGRWDLYVDYRYLNENHRKRIKYFSEKVAPSTERYFTDGVQEKELNENVVVPYLTIYNEIAFVIKQKIFLNNERWKIKTKILKFSMRKNNVSFNFQLLNSHPNTVKKVVLRLRNKSVTNEYSLNFISTSHSKYSVLFDVNNIKWEAFYWDLFVVLENENEEIYVKLKNPVSSVKKQLQRYIFQKQIVLSDNFMLYPYLTKDHAIAFCYRKKEWYETSKFRFLEYIAYLVSILLKPYFKQKEIWLAFEKNAEAAQDNGFYFFKYCIDNKKINHFYYVIKKNSNDYLKIRDYQSRIIEYMSFKYLLYIYVSKLLISSESKKHVYDIRIQKGPINKAIRKKSYVFLQHGVLGLKKVDSVYKKNTANGADLFITSSEIERQIVRDYFGYKKNEIAVTGLARWDYISPNYSSNEIMIMPTWRSWMDGISDEKFINSTYFKKYKELLFSKGIEALLKKYNLKISFFLHPKFKEHINNFHSDNEIINIYKFGEEPLNNHIMNSRLLITDYSSVAWDMLYQGKPIIFYHFDADKYLNLQGSYLDLNTELFGDKVSNLDELINTLENFCENNFQEKKVYKKLSCELLPKDQFSHSDKIFRSINENKERIFSRKKSVIDVIKTIVKRNQYIVRIWLKVRKLSNFKQK